MSKEIQYRKGKVDLAAIVASFVKNADINYIRACLSQNHPELFKKERCPNCDASMREDIYFFDILNALLILKMGQAARIKTEEETNFTIANQVHVPSLPTTLAIKCRTTQCSKLGLVAKIKNNNGRHAKGMWCLTVRGWAALRGEPVPAQVKVWRGEIQERYEDTITLAEAFKVHRENIEQAIARQRKPKQDYRGEVQDYSPSDWVGFGGFHEGNLF